MRTDCNRCLRRSNPVELVLVEAFQIWTVGMAVALHLVLEGVTHWEIVVERLKIRILR